MRLPLILLYIAFMRSLFLYFLLFISIQDSAQMEPGLISVEGFGSTIKAHYKDLFFGGEFDVKREQYGLMLNGWLSKNIFLGAGKGNLTYIKTIATKGEVERYDGKTYRFHAGYAAGGSPTSKIFAGGKLRYLRSRVHFYSNGSSNSIEGNYWSAGLAGFIGYRPCKYFIITTEPLTIERYKLGPIFQGNSADEVNGSIPLFTFNLQVHICYPILGQPEKRK